MSGDAPSKEAFLHLAMYQERPSAQGIVHLHCTHCVAVSCLQGFTALPPITAYYVMRIRELALIPYYRPGDRALAEAVREKAKKHHAVLLANHGPVVAGKSLEDAVVNAEELEETAKLYLLLEGRRTGSSTRRRSPTWKSISRAERTACTSSSSTSRSSPSA